MLLKAVYLTVLVSFAVSFHTWAENTRPHNANELTYALAWKQTSAEYRALYHQGFNIAKQQVEAAVLNRTEDSKPLAIISDLDDTLMLPLAYWRLLMARDKSFFNDAIWDMWLTEQQMVASPGALEFLNFCQQNQVDIFYVSSRDQGEKTREIALENLKSLSFPLESPSHLTLLSTHSNKQIRQTEISENYHVVVYLGDNLNDFKRDYYLKDVEKRITRMNEDKHLFGTRFVLFPNPTDGHWLRSIFGVSEPEESLTNRRILQEAARYQSVE